MLGDLNRRAFVRGAVGTGALAAAAELGFLSTLPPVSAAAARLAHDKVQLQPDIEPLVRLIEETDRAKLLEVVADKIRGGASYQDVLAALMLAGVRNIQARPVGFEFHTVLVVNSAHLASLASPDRERWLPLFWALDNFKRSQEVKKGKGGWVMPALDDGKLPGAAEAKSRFVAAMDNWEEEGADVAVAALTRTAGAAEVSELFWRYGARDFRDIGHKAIYAANAWRTLQTIGWRHAEPILRSLAFACLDHEGDNPAKRDAEPDQPWRANLKRAQKIRQHWTQGKRDPNAAKEFLVALRTASFDDACELTVDLLNRRVDPSCVWDGVFLTAGELLMRNPGIVGLHAVTSVNALHFGYQASGNDETRRLLTLQAPAFLALFRKRIGTGAKNNVYADTLDKDEGKAAGPGAVEEILADVSGDRVAAARKTLALLAKDPAAAEPLMAAARRLIFTKGTDSHDYKFSSAALEDFYHTSPAWRARFLATSLFWMKGSGDRDNALITRAQAALARG